MNFRPDLVDYVQRCLAGGMNYTQIVFHLCVEDGYALPVAHRIVEAVIEHGGNGARLTWTGPQEQPPRPDIRSSDEGYRLDLGDIQAEIVFEQLAPRVVLINNFLSDEECGRMRHAACDFSPSDVLVEGASARLETVRNSDSAVVARGASIVDTVEQRISRLTGWPSSHGEALQIARYGREQTYKPHYDFYLPGNPRFEKQMQQGGQRIATLIMYLQAPEQGGVTYLANLGQKFTPRPGSALFFAYPDTTPRSGTLHSGEPVITGEKWIATKWFREREHRRAAAMAAPAPAPAPAELAT